MISNCKYDTPEKPWYTAFHASPISEWYEDIEILWFEFADYEWLKKARSRQTVPGRFHLHLIQKP